MDTRVSPDDLAQLRNEVVALRAEITTLRAEHRPSQRSPSHRRVPRRFLPLALVVLLVVLTPLATFAAAPFNDLTGGVHDANIGLIYDAGITKGCVPNVSYCPTGNVTREEMASFLARTAGLGDNAPVVNAKTAQTATNATNAQTAVSAQTATNATTATNAGNADTLGGYAPSGLNRVAFSTTRLNAKIAPATSVDIVQVSVTIPGPGSQVVVVRGDFNASGLTTGGSILVSLRPDSDLSAPASLSFPYQTTAATVGIVVHNESAFVAAPGTHTYTLVARAFDTANDLNVAGVRLIATTHPFGPDGAPGTR